MKFRLAALVGLLALFAFSLAGPYRDLAHKLEGAKTLEEARSILDDESSNLTLNDSVIDELNDSKSVDQFRHRVQLLAKFEDAADQPKQSASELARSVKSDHRFRKAEDDREANWLARALSRVKLDQPPRTRMPSVSIPGVTELVWVLLGLFLLAFLGFCVWFFSARFQRAQRSRQVLEDDEPLRSSNEWISIGAAAEQNGDLRGAVRAYYVASLIRLDELSVLRFVPSETNWQHYRRLIRLQNGEAFGFRTYTKRFDDIWFGYLETNRGEVADFRALPARLAEIARTT